MKNPLTINYLENNIPLDDSVKSLDGYIISTSGSRDRATARNNLIDKSVTDWQFGIEPGEVIMSGQNNIFEAVKSSQNAFRVQVIQGDILTKPIRIWNKKSGLKYKNPVYESVQSANAPLLDVIIMSSANDDPIKRYEIASEWEKRSPASPDACYYYACSCLENSKYAEFKNAAEKYLFFKTNHIESVTMIRYYLSLLEITTNKDIKNCIRNCLACISANILMGEFWCLLGDIHYYLLKEFNKAVYFYQNGIILGSRRFRDDNWPLQISKYKDYPEEMINSCKKILSNQVAIAKITK